MTYVSDLSETDAVGDLAALLESLVGGPDVEGIWIGSVEADASGSLEVTFVDEAGGEVSLRVHSGGLYTTLEEPA